MLRKPQEGPAPPPTGERLAALRSRIGELVDSLVDGGRLVSTLSTGADQRDEANGQLDAIAVEARRVESLLVRRIAELDRTTGRIIVDLRQVEPQGLMSGLLRRLRRSPPERVAPLTDPQAAAQLNGLLLETDRMLQILDEHRAFLADTLRRCEPPLEEGLLRLRALSTQEGEPSEALRSVIDLVQDLVERLIAMLAETNLLAHKLAIDAEERVVTLAGLATKQASDPADMPKLSGLFYRAERGVLSMRALHARKDRIDEAFRRRLAASRQVVA